jgi:hypothetical protein
VSMLDVLNECNILKLILIVRFACATLDMGHPIYHNVVPGTGLSAKCILLPSYVYSNYIYYSQPLSDSSLVTAVYCTDIA